MKLNDFQLYEIDGVQYSLNELREFIRIADESCKQYAESKRRQKQCTYKHNTQPQTSSPETLK